MGLSHGKMRLGTSVRAPAVTRRVVVAFSAAYHLFPRFAYSHTTPVADNGNGSPGLCVVLDNVPILALIDPLPADLMAGIRVVTASAYTEC